MLTYKPASLHSFLGPKLLKKVMDRVYVQIVFGVLYIKCEISNKRLKITPIVHRYCTIYVNFKIACFTPYVISTFKIMDIDRIQ